MHRLLIGLALASVSLASQSNCNAKDPSAQQPRKLEGHDKLIVGLAVSSDGKRIGSASLDGTTRIWDANTGQVLHTLKGHEGPVFAVAFSPDGKTVATAGADKLIRLWETGTGKETRQLRGHTGKVASLAFAPNGKMLASAGYDSTIRLWDTEKGEETRSLKGHGGRVTSIGFSADGRNLVSGGVLEETFNFGGNAITTGTSDQLRWWDVEQGKELRKLETRGSTAAVSPDGKTALSAGLVPDIQRVGGGISFDGFDQISLARTEDGKSGRTIKWRGATCALSSDGKLLASGAGVYLHLLDFGFTAHNGANARNLDNRARLWDAETGKERACLTEQNATVLVFTPDGKTLVTGTTKGLLLLWPVDAILREADSK